MLHKLDNIQNTCMQNTSSPDLPYETFYQYFKTLNTAKNSQKDFHNLIFEQSEKFHVLTKK